ncbi:hypothetical protein ACFO0N_12475 [Halobium salinum]|uniref:DUF7837 domain-containing protein n=1 Tax=Halobium salinum TaxID=1364940 RepID=A0ABD5PDG8_9EURY|nr:hypothetical protein [Halobium salinum]
MSEEIPSLGVCPRCERTLGEEWLLIEYERADGSRGQFAECPECDAVVAPESE